MRLARGIIPILILALGISACGEAQETSEDVLGQAYTAVALTQASEPTQTLTNTPAPTSTATEEPTATESVSQEQDSAAASNGSYSFSTANGCYDAIYVSDVTIPDGTSMNPGEAFTKTWKFRNTGACDWDDDFLLTFVSGEDMDGDDVEIETSVDAGDTVSLSVDLVAPSSDGTYTGYWRLAEDDGDPFGGTVYVMIVVSGDTATPTSTTTGTSTATYTSTATTAATSTSTTAPTNTNTTAPTNTATTLPTDTATPTP